MKYKLYKYQEKAVKNLLIHSDKLFNTKEKDKYILLKAITGAGKTVISANYIEEMFKEYNNLAFIWISVGKGELHLQSRNSLKEKLSSTISIKTDEEALRSECLHHKDVLILNWEGLNTTKTDSITGETYFDNVSMREGEKRNLKQLWKATRNNGTKIVLIIDESHNTAKSKTSKEIVSLINPDFVLEITATPNKERIPNGIEISNNRAFYEDVKTDEVIEEGVIKKSIILNDIEDKEETYNSSIELMIKEAINKRKEILEAYKLEKENINPLCIIQLPDGKDGETLKEEISDILEKEGYSISNDKLAIWLSNEKKNLGNIRDNNSPVDFLIFKQAVATGWDCPRACILVKLRDIKSTIFDLQTIGRILRMPTRRHYSSECLNNGYIYTNSEYSINTGDYDQVLPIRQILKKEFRDDVLSLTFNSEKVRVSDKEIDTKVLEKDFERKIKKQPLNLGLDKLVLNLKRGKTNVTDFDKTSKEEVNIVVDRENRISLTQKDIEREFEKFIKGLSNKQYQYKNIESIILKYFKTIPGLNSGYTTLKKAVLLNRDLITQYFNEIKMDYKNNIYSYIEDFEFKFKEDRHTTEKDTISYKKCAYYKHFVSKYDTETTFEKYLENLDSVKYWIKNVDSGDGLSIAYKYNNIDHEFYPDYVVRFKDGNIGLYEVKHIEDSEKETVTKVKIISLKDYALNNNLKCGLVEVKDNKVYSPTLPKELK